MTELTKQNNTGITKEETIGFMIPTSLINTAAVEKVQRYLPELDEKTRAFDRQNSQATLSLMTLTMLGGQSPYRMMRQVMAEAEKRKHRPKPGSAAGRIQKRLRKAGFTQDELDNLGSKHRAWKAARKAGTLGDWEEKYHPGRGKYKNKNKTKAKIEKISTNPIKQNLQTVAEKVKKKKARNPVEMMFGR